MEKVIMYGAMWCRDCIRAKRLLDAHGVIYEYRDIAAEPELADTVISLNEQLGLGPKRRIPVILIGEKILSEPSDFELAQALNLAP